MVCDAVSIPVIAAGGIGSGKSMLAAEALGAEGVQIGTRFAASVESSAHEAFKKKITELNEGDTTLTMKQLTPVRLIKNEFYHQVAKAEQQGVSVEELQKILGSGRAKKGIFEGDLMEGELEIGQVAASIRDVKSASEILHEIWNEYHVAKRKMCEL